MKDDYLASKELRRSVLSYVRRRLEEAIWYEEQLKKIREELREYEELFNIQIDFDNWKVKE